ncbi:hypothetical protein [Comamonas humi]
MISFALIVSAAVLGGILFGVAKLFWPKSEKAQSVAFWIWAAVCVGSFAIMYGGGPIDPSATWRR